MSLSYTILAFLAQLHAYHDILKRSWKAIHMYVNSRKKNKLNIKSVFDLISYCLTLPWLSSIAITSVIFSARSNQPEKCVHKKWIREKKIHIEGIIESVDLQYYINLCDVKKVRQYKITIYMDFCDLLDFLFLPRLLFRIFLSYARNFRQSWKKRVYQVSIRRQKIVFQRFLFLAFCTNERSFCHFCFAKSFQCSYYYLHSQK